MLEIKEQDEMQLKNKSLLKFLFFTASSVSIVALMISLFFGVDAFFWCDSCKQEGPWQIFYLGFVLIFLLPVFILFGIQSLKIAAKLKISEQKNIFLKKAWFTAKLFFALSILLLIISLIRDMR